MNTNTGGAKLASRHVIVNLSTASNERNRIYQAPFDIKMPSTRPTKTTKALFPGGYTPRKRGPNEAGPQTGDWKHTIYKVSDGDTIQHPRPGSMHAYTLPSHGNRT